MNARGFTLLEVLVALSILSVAVVASIQGFAQGLRLLKLSGDHQNAMLIADQKLREVTEPVEGREEGTEGTFQWSRTVTPVPMPELENLTRATRWRGFEIDVRVRWDEKREVQLSTLRTVAKDTLITIIPEQGTPGTPGTPGQPGAPVQGTTPRTPGTPTTPGRPPVR
jgi:type II secretion system protein I